MKSHRAVVCLVLLIPLSAAGAFAQQDQEFSFEDDLEKLAQAMTRLVETIETQARATRVDQDRDRLRIAVSILDIRVRRYERLQAEVQELEEQEATTTRFMEKMESQLDAARARHAEATDDRMAANLKTERDMLQIELDSLQSRLDHTRERHLDSQSRLMDQQKLVRDVESVVDSWLEDLQFETEDAGAP